MLTKTSEQSKGNKQPAANREVPIQAKFEVGKVGDKYEQEADTIADQVMKMDKSHIQRKCEECEEEEVQMKPELQFSQPKDRGNEVSPWIQNQIENTRGNGQALDNTTRSFMESRMQSDFSNVKVHTNGEAVQMNRELGARAFTVGNDIYFNSGQYSPDNSEGKRLLAHELTHTVQQGFSGNKIQKYSHEDCDESTDLSPHIWPADRMAKRMVDNAIAKLTASPITASTEGLLDKHFNDHSASTISSVLEVFQNIKSAFDSDDYTYECENDCDSENAYVYAIWSDVHICMNVLRGKDNRGIGAIIVHEFSHYYGGTDDEQYYFSFGVGSAPASLSTSDAVDNADSYEGFAYDSY